MEYTTTQHRSPQSELFDLLDRLQSARLDDQRCELPNFNNGSGKNSSQNSQGGGAGSNNSDSRQSASKLMLQRILKHPPPYPTVALVNQGSHWIEPNVDPTAVNSNKPNQLKVMCRNSARVDSAEESARLYRVHFAGYEHFNFCANDIERGGQPLVLSIKVSDPADSCTNGTNDVIHDDENNNCHRDAEGLEESSRNVRLILRSIDKTVHQVLRLSDLIQGSLHNNTTTTSSTSRQSLASAIIESVMTHLAMPAAVMPVMFPGISNAITSFDEHGISNTFKFGVIYQKFGQVTEESIFGNRSHSPAMEEFLQLLGQHVRLSEHTGYRGGLDTRHGQTGTHALYEKYQGNEIMFHVSTLLPFVESDDQQLQRKCHIGNDIVSIVFQEVNTPFTPDMIASHFLHAYIVVQPIDPCTSITRYRVSVVAQKDVPPFGPPLNCAIFDKGLAFKDFLLSKLINGERAAYQANKFQMLHQRTRATLLVNLAKDLREHTVEYINANYQSSLNAVGAMTAPGGVASAGNGNFKDSKSPSPSSSRLFTSVKRALKHVGSTKHELNRHVSSGSLSEVVLSYEKQPSSERKTSSSSTVATGGSGGHGSSEDTSVKADSGHGDSDNGSLPSSPTLTCHSGRMGGHRKKLLSTSQPHLAVLSDHHLVDTSSVDAADDIIFERTRNNPRKFSGSNNNTRPTVIPPPLQFKKHSSSSTNLQQVVTGLPVPGASLGAQLQLGPPGGLLTVDRLAQSQLHQQKTDRVTVISGAVTTIPVGGSPTSGSTSSTASSTSSSTRSAASAGSTGSSSGASAGSSSSQGSDKNNGHSPPMPMNQSNSANINSSQARLHQDVSRLRVDKLELLRQALSAQHEVRQLRQREAQLETDLALAAAEIRRLKNQLKSAAASAGVGGVHPDSSSQVHLPMVQPSSLMPAAVQQNATTTSRRTVQMHFPL